MLHTVPEITSSDAAVLSAVDDRSWTAELSEQTRATFDASADPYRLAGRGLEIPVGPETG